MCCGNPDPIVDNGSAVARFSAKRANIQNGLVELLTSQDQNGTSWYGAVTKARYRVQKTSLFVQAVDVDGFLKIFDHGRQIFTVAEVVERVVPVEPTIVETPVVSEVVDEVIEDTTGPVEDNIVVTDVVEGDPPVAATKRGKR